MNQAADQFYFEVAVKRQMAEQKQAITKRLRQLIARLQRRRENLRSDGEELQKNLESKDYGDILTAWAPTSRAVDQFDWSASTSARKASANAFSGSRFSALEEAW